MPLKIVTDFHRKTGEHIDLAIVRPRTARVGDPLVDQSVADLIVR
jgi:hypothetical protein